MVSKAVIVGIISGAVISIIIFAVIYSYQQVHVVNQDVDITDIDFSTTGTVEGLANFLQTGNYPALLSSIDKIDLVITADIQNGGFLPATIPNVPYNVYVNNVPVGEGQITELLFIEGGHTEKLLMNHSIPGKELEPTITSIVNQGGILTVKVDFTPQVSWGGFESPQLFVIQKNVNLIEEIKKRI